mmetsp:Transcript_2582/g.6250  ORF Transcript_2582/g.6250 Transcript_2582/m.6250 type:complete len:245 (-) Transcript_2582:231-965(-)
MLSYSICNSLQNAGDRAMPTGHPMQMAMPRARPSPRKCNAATRLCSGSETGDSDTVWYSVPFASSAGTKSDVVTSEHRSRWHGPWTRQKWPSCTVTLVGLNRNLPAEAGYEAMYSVSGHRSRSGRRVMIAVPLWGSITTSIATRSSRTAVAQSMSAKRASGCSSKSVFRMCNVHSRPRMMVGAIEFASSSATSSSPKGASFKTMAGVVAAAAAPPSPATSSTDRLNLDGQSTRSLHVCSSSRPN